MRRSNPAVTTLTLILVSIAVSGLSDQGLAQPPDAINYQGRLTDASGNPVPDGVYSINFKIYASASGDDSLWWSGPRSVQVRDGLFDYLLGSQNPFQDGLFDMGCSRYLGFQIGSDPEITPRTSLMAVPYAFESRRADLAKDLLVPISLSASSNDAVLEATNSTIAGVAIAAHGANTDASLGRHSVAVYAAHTPTSNYAKLAEGNSAIYGNASSGYAGHFEGDVYVTGKIGIGTDSLDAQVEVGELLRVRGLNYSGAIYPDSGAGIEITYRPSDNTGLVQVFDRDVGAPAGWGNLYLGNGRVGIGEINPAEKLHVDGKIRVDSLADGAFYPVSWDPATHVLYRQTSSLRHKEDIESFQDDFDRILGAEPKSFSYRSSGQRSIGYIAEEFARLNLEELVIRDGEGRPDAIRYDLISIYLVELIKEIKAENEELRSRITALENR